MTLPLSPNFDASKLSQIFNHTTASYKFFWFLAILDLMESGKRISFEDLIIKALQHAWYPSQVSKLSLGLQDKLGAFLSESAISLVAEDTAWKEFKKKLHTNASAKEKLRRLYRYVPVRFISPWIKIDNNISSLNTAIDIANNQKTANDGPYFFEDYESLTLNDLWLEYFKTNRKILRDFCYWNLISYLQKRNPNIPNIPFKLFKPNSRALSRARRFWTSVQEADFDLKCIYSGERLKKGFSLDHFVPWQFVAHDLIWNIVPTSRPVNSSKGNKLPSLSRYLDDFIRLQFESLNLLKHHNKSILKTMIEDYELEFGITQNELTSLSKVEFDKHMKKTIKPLCQIAERNGFKSGWEYVPE